MNQINDTRASKANTDSAVPQTPVDPRYPTLSAADIAEWDIHSPQIRELELAQRAEEEASRASTLRPPSPAAPSTYKETGRTAGRNSGKLQPGYGDSHRLLPGFSSPEYPDIYDVEQQDEERHEKAVTEWRSAESDIKGQIRADEKELEELTSSFHPTLRRVLTPMLRMADGDLQRVERMEFPSPPKSSTSKKGLPQVSGDTAFRALKEMQTNGGISVAASSKHLAKAAQKSCPPGKADQPLPKQDKQKRTRFPWMPEQEEALAKQALAMGLLTAGHGKKGDIAASCVATLNTLPSFSKHGGIKIESMNNKLRTLVAEHREDQKKDPHVSGKRTGTSEELHQAMCDIVQDLDEAAATKGEGDAAAVAEEARKNVRAEKTLAAASKTSGSGSRKARSGEGGAASTAAPRPVSSAVASFLESKTDSPASKKQKQEIDLINAKIKLKEVETKQHQETAASQQQAFFREMMDKMSAVVREMQQKK